jgi:hypothetical protein
MKAIALKKILTENGFILPNTVFETSKEHLDYLVKIGKARPYEPRKRTKQLKTKISTKNVDKDNESTDN